jgi:hypothetical protein
MSAKVKEIKDDAIIDIKVNKAFYLMIKGVLYTLFLELQKCEDPEKLFNEVGQKQYKELNELQKAFQTTTLLLAEIERQASLNNLYDELEINADDFTE